MWNKIKKAMAVGTGAIMAGASALATYSANYTSGDLDDITVDVLGKVGVGVSNFGDVIGLFVGIGVGLLAVSWGIGQLK